MKSKFYGAFVLNRRVVLHAIDATPARWRGVAGSSPLDGASAATSSPKNDSAKNYRYPTYWLISTQAVTTTTGAGQTAKALMTTERVSSIPSEPHGRLVIIIMLRDLCGNHNLRRGRSESSRRPTPSTRRLLDGVAVGRTPLVTVITAAAK